jgi:Ca2+/H+ antiporter, TMEM165/GDT1 family
MLASFADARQRTIFAAWDDQAVKLTMIDVAHSGPAFLASFLASSVECVEALTIVLAVGAVRGWRPALFGAGLAGVLLAVLVAVFGAGLGLIPLASLQTAIGVLLLLFGMRWLRKAVLRAGGVIALRDEAANYASETGALRSAAGHPGGWDPIGIATSFKAVTLEGIEVVFIVIAVGAVGGALVPATVGALAAVVLVAAIGLMLHRPLARVPENALKFAVGVMLSSFGTFWIGEGYGVDWPGGDLSALGLIAGFLAAALLGVGTIRRIRRQTVLTPTA